MVRFNQALLALVVLSLTISISGCLDVNLGKELFGKKAIPLEAHYEIVEKASLNHTFNTIIPENVTDEAKFDLAEKTERLIVNIKVNIKTLPELGPLEEFLEIIEQYLGQRYVTVILIQPDGSSYFNKTYVETTEEILPIDKPTVGVWKLKVEAYGIGHPDYPQYSDSYSILATARESL